MEDKTTILAPGPNGMVPVKASAIAALGRAWMAALKEVTRD
jgi:hypothetical protein